MNVIRQPRKRLELVLMLFVGLIWGICLSQLLPRARYKSYSDVITIKQTELSSSTLSLSSPYTAEWKLSDSNDPLRILCIVMINPHHSRAIHIKRTWGRRCGKLIFMGSKQQQQHEQANHLDIFKVLEGMSSSWGKTRSSLQHAHKHYYAEYDWFLKVTDDTFVILENLQHFLLDYNPQMPIYFGSNIWENVKEGYLSSGGAGYVFSKAALDNYMKYAHNNASICSNRNYGIESIELKRCLRNVGVIAGDSRDEQGRPRFLASAPYSKQDINNTSSTFYSNSAISFHYSNAKDFYILDYIIYRLRPFGLN